MPGTHFVKITQRTIPLCRKQVTNSLTTIMILAGYETWDVSAWFCSTKKIAELNRLYRDTKGVTDILSFAAFPVSLLERNSVNSSRRIEYDEP